MVKECIKTLAEVFNVPQAIEARSRERWDTWFLGMVATDLSRMLNEERIRYA